MSLDSSVDKVLERRREVEEQNGTTSARNRYFLGGVVDFQDVPQHLPAFQEAFLGSVYAALHRCFQDQLKDCCENPICRVDDR